ncbi:PAS domain-containing sensor histidine kinase [Marinilabilia sp.]
MRESQANKRTNISDILKIDEGIFHHLIKNSFDLLVLLDANGEQLYVSDSCEKILGYKPEELTNISVIEAFLHPNDQQKAIEGLQNIILNNDNGGTQYRHKHKNGGWVYLEAYGTNQLDNPEIKAVVLNVRDISERKKAEEDLKKSEASLKELNATKDRFFSIIGHDLRSPFSSIVGFTDLLIAQIQEKDYDGIEDYARIIQKSSQQAMDLLSNLLEWSRAQSGRIDFVPEYIELGKMIHQIIDLFKNTALKKSIKINNKTQTFLPIWADKHMVESILRNLISNSLKFSPFQGEIIISARAQGNKALVSVAGKGVGMKKEDLGKLFRIELSHSTRGTNNETGTGLGLLLCKDFVKMHKGQIWAESEENKGSTFFFTLPLA